MKDHGVLTERLAMASTIPPAFDADAESAAAAIATGAAATDPGVARRRQNRRRRLTVYVLRVLTAVVWIGSWELSTRLGIVDKFFFGQPSGIYDRLHTWVTEGTALGPLWQQVAVTMEETVLGFLVGSILGVIFGILLGRNRLLSDVLSPYIKALNSIPRVVLGALFAISLGLDLRSKVATAAVLVFFVVFFNAFQGVREVDQNLVANVRVLGASPIQVAVHVTIPSAMTWIIASLHTAFGFAIIGALVAEVLGAQHGIGLIISQAQGTFDPNTVFACMVIIAVITLGAEYLITVLERSLLKWRPPNRSDAQAI